MQFKLKATSVVTLEHSPGAPTSRHVETKFFLDVSKEIDKKAYVDSDGMPTKDGIQAATLCFVQGVVGCIHFGHQKGFINDAEHLRYIISELERGFVANREVGLADYNSEGDFSK